MLRKKPEKTNNSKIKKKIKLHQIIKLNPYFFIGKYLLVY